VFARSILAPFKLLQPDVIPKLQLLVSSITLRRLKDRINLPKRHNNVVKLPFTPEEKAIHEFFKRKSDMKVNVMAGVGGQMSYARVLVEFMRLRRICAHGKELLGEADLKQLQGISVEDAIDLDKEGESNDNTKAVYETFVLRQQMSQHGCIECGEYVGEETEESDEDILAYHLPCYCLVCRDCYASKRSPLRSIVDANKHMTCPYCDDRISAGVSIITRRGLEEYKAETEAARDARQTKDMTQYSGPHSKTRALISHLQKSIEDSSELPLGEQPIKSVVFSTWTSHLNLIQIALDDAGIPFTRLDGSMSRKARNRALDAFSKDHSILVFPRHHRCRWSGSQSHGRL